MNLSNISKAINTLCHQCSPAPAPPGAGAPAPVWFGMDFAAGPDQGGYLAFVHPDDSRSWFDSLVLPPDATSDEDYRKRLYAGEVSYMIEHRFIKDAGQPPALPVLPPAPIWDTIRQAREDFKQHQKDFEQFVIDRYSGKPQPEPLKLAGNWWKVGGMPPVFYPPSVTQADLEAAYAPTFTVRQITEQQAADEINGRR